MKHLSLVLILATLCGCLKDPFDVPGDDVSTNQLAGVWIIDDDSLRFLTSSLHYQIFTNKTDHVLLLNSDGTCVFKGFAVYQIRDYDFPEVDFANGIENAMNTREPEVVTDRFSWCESLNNFPYLRGPYSSTSIITNDTARMFRKTLWSNWRICKSEKDVDVEDCTQFHGWKYKICLDRSLPNYSEEFTVTYKGDAQVIRTKDTLRTFRGSSVDAYLSKDDRGLYLFLMAVLNDHPPTRGVKLRKIEENVTTHSIHLSQNSTGQSKPGRER